MSEGEGSKTLGKEGETVSGSIFLDSVTRGYGLRLRTSRGEDEMTISNTLTVRSGRFLTAPAIRWSRLYMTAHSYAGYAVTFHCIWINTRLNQKRMSLLITQDKKTRQSLCERIQKPPRTGIAVETAFVSHCGSSVLNSPPLVSDNFLNEAHYVLIDFSYSFSPVNTPKVLLLHSALPPCSPPPPLFSLMPPYLCYLSIASAWFLSAAPTSSGEQQKHLRELNGFQLAKQIPPLTLTLSHRASESLGSLYRQLEFNKPNMLTVLMERERGEARRESKRCALISPHSRSPGCYIFLIALNRSSCPGSLFLFE